MTCPCRCTCNFHRADSYVCTHEPSTDKNSSLYCRHYEELTYKGRGEGI